YGMLIADKRIDSPAVISLQGLMGPIAKDVYGTLKVHERFQAHNLTELVRNTGLFGAARDYRKRAVRERYILSKSPVVLGRTQWDRAYTAFINPSAHYHEVGEILRRPF